MTTHYIKNLDYKYIKGIQEDKINLLIFTKQRIHNAKVGDKLELSSSRLEESLKMVIEKWGYKSFQEITDKEAQQAGFLTKEFLMDELLSINDFDVITRFDDLKDVILFLVYIVKEEDYSEKPINLGYTWNGSSIDKSPFVNIFEKYKKKDYGSLYFYDK